MTKQRRSHTDPGWVNRRFARLEQQIREMAAAKRLTSSTIGSGGVRVRDGGRVIVEYPDGQTAITLGPQVADDGTVVGATITMVDETGEKTLFSIGRVVAGADPGFPAGRDGFQVGVDTVTITAADQAILGTPDAIVLLDPAFGIVLQADAGVIIDDAPTTASGANAYLDPVTGQVFRVSSSQRYKQDIVDADVDVDQVLQLQPRTFRLKAQVETAGDDAPWYVGFVAEEAAALGLDAWVGTDPEGPESFDYPQWVVALQAVARHQQARLTELEQVVADLTATVEQLSTEGGA